MQVQGALDEFVQVDLALSRRGRTREVHEVLHNLGCTASLLVQDRELPVACFIRLTFL